jgi:UDP-N-acetylmuramate dehydrogenase
MDKNNLKSILPGVEENVPMSLYTTFKIGGPARYFFTAKSEGDLVKAIKAAKEANLPFFILGGGSNLLVADKGYAGLIIKNQTSKIEIQDSKIHAEAGLPLSKIVGLAAKNSLAGLEWAAGIPGTFGGAVYGNISAFGPRMADITESVKVLDTKSFKAEDIAGKDCGFNNKESIFKKNKNLIILSAVLKLKEGDEKEIREQMKKYTDYRRDRHPINMPSAGCLFKNCEGKIEDKKLLQEYPELAAFKDKSMIPTSYLIDKAGLKGKIMGKAQISEKHANFIVNLGGASAEDVLGLAKLIKEKVYAKFRIKLEEEVQKIGF